MLSRPPHPLEGGDPATVHRPSASEGTRTGPSTSGNVTLGHASGCWIFRPQPPRETRADDSLGHRIRLGSALKSAHGAGVGFEVRMCSGANPTLQLLANDSGSVRWVTRVLTNAYEHSQWVRATPFSGFGGPGVIWDAVRARDWPQPFRSPADGVSLLDGVILALAGLPHGVTCVWSFRPMRLTHVRWGDSGPPVVPPPMRRPGVTAPFGRPREDIVEERPERPLFWDVRVRLESPVTRDGDAGVRRAAAVLESATRTSHGNGLRCHPRRWWTPPVGVGFPLTDSEMVMVLPSPGCPASGSPTHRAGRPPILPLGRTSAGTVVGPEVEKGQGRHLAILGETGMGKSSLLVSVGHRVVADSGLILFDPLGDTARALREEIPARWQPRVMWVAPGANLGINALQGIGGGSAPDAAHQERQLNDLVHSLRRVRSGRYAESGFWGPRLEEMLTRALRAAAAFPGGTLVDAHTLLASGGRTGFRTIPADAVEAVQELGDRIRSRPEDADGARRLLHEVTRSPILVRMLCDRAPVLAARDLVAPGRIVLIAGDAESVGESTARYLLSVYLALVWSELLSRPSRSKTFVVLDEAQWFVHESLSEMLRLGRRRNVHVILATQAIASLPESVAEAVWTNVADFVAFRGSPEEAREFARASRGITPESILALPRGNAAVLLGKGHSVHWIRTSRIPGPRAPVQDAEVEPSPDIGAERDTLEVVRSEETTSSLPSEDEGSDGAGKILAAISLQARRSPHVVPLRVSLAELRRDLDPGGRAVRTAGGILGRSGAIVRTDRDEFGTVWWIDPARIVPAEPRPHPEAAPRTSDPTQHS